MALTPGTLSQLGISFSPPRFLRRLSSKQYEERRDRCTKQQLSLLLVSPEYKAWVKQQAGQAAGPEGLLALFAVIIGLLLFVQPWLAPATTILPNQSPVSPTTTTDNSHQAQQDATLPSSLHNLLSGQFSSNANVSHISSTWTSAPDAASTQAQASSLATQLVQQLNSTQSELEAAMDLNVNLELALWQAQLRFRQLLMQTPVILDLDAAGENTNNIGSQAQNSAVEEPGVVDTRFDIMYTRWAKVEAGQPMATAVFEGHTLALLALFSLAVMWAMDGAVIRALKRRITGLHGALHQEQQAQAQLGECLQAVQMQAASKDSQLTEAQRAKQAAEAEIAAMRAQLELLESDAEAERQPIEERIEEYIKQRDAVVVEKCQLQNWLSMEEEYRRVKRSLAELASVVDERDEQLLSLNQELLHLQTHIKNELSAKEVAAAEMKRWLDQAQGQLQNTQSALNEKEADCKELAARLKQAAADVTALQAKAAAAAEQEGLAQAEKDGQLAEMKGWLDRSAASLQEARTLLAAKVQECQRVAEQLAAAQAQIATLEARAAAAEARADQAEQRAAALAGEQRAAAAALQGQVEGAMEAVKTTRRSMAAKLSQSQAACETLAAELQTQKAWYQRSLDKESSKHQADLARRDQLASVQPARLSAEASEEAAPHTPIGLPLAAPQATEEEGGHTPLAATVQARQPLAPLPLAPHGNQEAGEQFQDENVDPNAQATQLKDLAKRRVQEVYARHGKWGLTAFLGELGCTTGAAGAPVTLTDFQRVRQQGIKQCDQDMQAGQSGYQKALAEATITMLDSWQWPVPRVSTPKARSPYWFARGG
ncbi:hypothetical protein WJX72_004253 [[Myrmecia] bisecta]|uniref:Uncharacterized protein n=1 Tax=[Myrmecia] bisecta TaxID=41462 RepID=A0AAW1R5U1_9CHLO